MVVSRLEKKLEIKWAPRLPTDPLLFLEARNPMCVVLLALSPRVGTRVFYPRKIPPIRWVRTLRIEHVLLERRRVLERKVDEGDGRSRRQRVGAGQRKEGNIHEPLQANLFQREHRRRLGGLIELGSLNKYLKFPAKSPSNRA